MKHSSIGVVFAGQVEMIENELKQVREVLERYQFVIETLHMESFKHIGYGS